MSILHDVARARLLSRYRMIFRTSTMAFGAAVFIVALGVLAVIFASDMTLLATGLLLLAASGLMSYKVALSTMGLMDAEYASDQWSSLSR